MVTQSTILTDLNYVFIAIPLRAFAFTSSISFFFNDPATTEIYTYLHYLSLHAALPIFERSTFLFDDKGVLKREWRVVKVKHHAAKGSEEHTSELQSLMRISYAVFCLKKKKII